MAVTDENWTYTTFGLSEHYQFCPIISKNFDHLIVLSYRFIFRLRKFIYRNGIRPKGEEPVQLIIA